MKLWILSALLFMASVFSWYILTNNPYSEILAYIVSLFLVSAAGIAMILMCAIFHEFGKN